MCNTYFSPDFSHKVIFIENEVENEEVEKKPDFDNIKLLPTHPPTEHHSIHFR